MSHTELAYTLADNPVLKGSLVVGFAKDFTSPFDMPVYLDLCWVSKLFIKFTLFCLIDMSWPITIVGVTLENG